MEIDGKRVGDVLRAGAPGAGSRSFVLLANPEREHSFDNGGVRCFRTRKTEGKAGGIKAFTYPPLKQPR